MNKEGFLIGENLKVFAHSMPIAKKEEFSPRVHWWGHEDKENIFGLTVKIPLPQDIKEHYSIPEHITHIWCVTFIPEALSTILGQDAFKVQPFQRYPTELLGVPEHFFPEKNELLDSKTVKNGLVDILDVAITPETLEVLKTTSTTGILSVLMHGTNHNSRDTFITYSAANGAVELQDLLKGLPSYMTSTDCDFDKDIGLVALRVCNMRHQVFRKKVSEEKEPDFLEVLSQAYKNTIKPQIVNVNNQGFVRARRYQIKDGSIYLILEKATLIKNPLQIPISYALSLVRSNKALGKAVVYPDGKTVIS